MEIVRQKNVATIVSFPLVDANGVLVTASANPDSEIDAYSDSVVPNGFVSCTNEATEVGTSGWYYLSLTQAEMNVDYINLQIKSDGALTQCLIIRTVVGDPLLLATTVATDAIKTDTAAILLDTDTMEADLKTYLDAIESNLDGDVVAVKAETALIVEDTGTTIPASLTTIQADLDNTAQYKATGFSTHNASDVWSVGIKVITGGVLTTPNDYKANVAGLATEANASTNTSNIQTNIDANETKIDTAITNIGNLNNITADSVWAVVTRQLSGTISDFDELDTALDLAHGAGSWLTGGGEAAPTEQEIWEYVNRSLTTPADYKATGFSIPNEYDIVIASLQTDLDNPSQYKANVAGLAPANEYDTKLTNLQSDVTDVKTKTDNLPVDTETLLNDIAGLLGKHQYIDTYVFTSGKLSSCRIRIYDTKANAEAHEAIGLLSTFTVTVTWDDTDLESYTVVKE